MRKVLGSLIAFTLFLFPVVSAHAAGLSTIRLTASRTTILSDGKDSAEILAEPRDSDGSPMPDGTQVTFSTNLGTLSPTAITTIRGGAARVRLTSQSKGTATVQAVVPGGGFAKVDVSVSDNPEDTFEGNAYVSCTGNASVAYDADDKVIDALGKPRAENSAGLPGAHVTFRDLDVYADDIQVDCVMNALRATGSVIAKRGAHRLLCNRLFLPLMNGIGYAVAEQQGHLRGVRVSPTTLELETAANGVPTKVFEFTDMSAASFVLTARQILLFPNDKLQFKRPKVYQNGQAMVSMAFYSLPLYAGQLSSDQFLSIGSEGVSMDLPVYYDLTPASTGIFHVRHGERSGRNVLATQPGWSLDLIQDYNSAGNARRYTGQLGFTGISGSDWGARWSHSQQLSSSTQGTFFLALPQHRSLFGSTSLTHQMGFGYVGMNLSGNRSITSIASENYDSSFYLEGNGSKVGASGYTMALGTTTGFGHGNSSGFVSNSNTSDVHARFTSKAFNLDKQTSVSHTVTLGNQWSNAGGNGFAVTSTLTADHTLRGLGRVQFGYDYTHQPVSIQGLGQHRLTASLFANRKRWDFSMYNTFIADVGSFSGTADSSYEIAPRWRLALSATMQRFSATQYQDYQLALSRTVLGRDLVLSYSTFSHRILLDLQAGRF